jgi:hypothetical protein
MQISQHPLALLLINNVVENSKNTSNIACQSIRPLTTGTPSVARRQANASAIRMDGRCSAATRAPNPRRHSGRPSRAPENRCSARWQGGDQVTPCADQDASGMIMLRCSSVDTRSLACTQYRPFGRYSIAFLLGTFTKINKPSLTQYDNR